MKNRIIITVLLSFLLLNSITSCSSMPEKAQPVGQFDVNKYLGTWYEIARFDYRFEKDLDNAIAQYSLNADGSVKVLNSGYNVIKNKWVSANGTAKFRGDKNVAALKVSFFGPFYAGYNVIVLEEYKYALVAGKNLDYLWILSREKTIPDHIKQNFISKAQEIGYDTSKLIWVKQDKKSPFDK
ncbi:apolipoprotein D and lipocalin family protein [Chryseobacterium bernardetii]|uniref:Outer membrane lipoprotein Blc n=2 Tax=Chryseobacterium TaxID=59732 RepID=A0A543EIF7_9FLAO|nr:MULTISPECIES: lipocalin family protein [Chryseobacterium]MDR6369805.1 apolipoprotein D and lipocalin family protein [Chryseobacterium vietnamense]MDR6440952.1 apolipoprotein D and lipocalin family protein [Chryseobacterium bernardetii]TQM21368.1 apolipoprotein D and lipocalin family protein [Chryseobacterium aquifrigidense]